MKTDCSGPGVGVIVRWLRELAPACMAGAGTPSDVLSSTLLICGGSVGKEPACPLQEIQETWVQSLGQDDPLEEDITTHSSILAWEIPWTEEPSGLQSMRSQKIRHDSSDTDTGRSPLPYTVSA